MPDPPGTLFSALLDSTSWNRMPSNSGVVTDRTRFCTFTSPGSAESSSDVSSWPLQRTCSFEHEFEGRATICTPAYRLRVHLPRIGRANAPLHSTPVDTRHSDSLEPAPTCVRCHYDSLERARACAVLRPHHAARAPSRSASVSPS